MGAGAEQRWRHTIGAADAATVSEQSEETELRQSPGGPGAKPTMKKPLVHPARCLLYP